MFMRPARFAWNGEHFVSQSQIQGQIPADAPVVLNAATKQIVLYFYRARPSTRENNSGEQVSREEVLESSCVACGLKVGGAVLRFCFRTWENSLKREARFQQMRSPGHRYVIIELVGGIPDRCLPEISQASSRDNPIYVDGWSKGSARVAERRISCSGRRAFRGTRMSPTLRLYPRRKTFNILELQMCVSVMPTSWQPAFSRVNVFPRLSGTVSGPLS